MIAAHAAYGRHDRQSRQTGQGGPTVMTYDSWKTTNPEDEFLGPALPPKRDYPYWVGALEGAIKMALIDLEYEHTEKAARRLRCVLAECEVALARP
jgi:hypothetical protein